MSREKQDYRDTLALLIERYPNQATLNQKQVAEFLGVSDRTVRRMKLEMNKTTRRISLIALARQISN